MSKRIYVASSWRNNYQPKVVRSLRNFGYSVYDFKNPWNSCPGFHWSDIDPYWQDWTKLSHPIASGYTSDYNAMEWADTFVGVMPFGRSASLEMGWASRQGKKTILLLENGEPELMVKMLDFICCDMGEILFAVEADIKKEA